MPDDVKIREQYIYTEGPDGKPVKSKLYPQTSVKAIVDMGEALLSFKDDIITPEIQSLIEAAISKSIESYSVPVANTMSGFTGFTTEIMVDIPDGAEEVVAGADGVVQICRIEMPFKFIKSIVPTITIDNSTAGWSIIVGDGTRIDLSSLEVEAISKYHAVLVGTMSSPYPSNSPCILEHRTVDAIITVDPTPVNP